VKKTVSVVAADRYRGSIRTIAAFTQLGDVPLNVDASPELLPNGKIRLSLTLVYNLPAPDAPGQQKEPTALPGLPPPPGRSLVSTNIQENLVFLLDEGKPVIVAQSADPISDRVVTVEVRAATLR
jgi:hypothetical protein